ncbi:unnamed protein product [Bursaphelenchus xylophilus]|uniref:(pine wood nematode) hypothetical protein n=1 Tax=Bursaphelenchus xylophilus TaxID=6326 RepID=A0A1I7SQL6_BURXY|nr:unnamed protein product [Bursaphelenchus xylophilus]CAG9110071.1 unnamed protein product [Bursaphelenchus xylophilus]
MSALRQFRLLLWKNLLVQWRSPIFTTLELVIPLILIGLTFGLMLGLRDTYENSYNTTTFPSWYVTGRAFDLISTTPKPGNKTDTILPLDVFVTGEVPSCPMLRIEKNNESDFTIGIEFAYAPNDTSINDVMENVRHRYSEKDLTKALKTIPGVEMEMLKNLTISVESEVKGFETEADLVDYMTQSFTHQCNNPLLAGVVFDSTLNLSSFDSTTNIQYKIRLANTKRRFRDFAQGIFPWDTKQLFSVLAFSGPIGKGYRTGGNPGYWAEGFLTIQHAIHLSVMEYVDGKRSSLLEDVLQERVIKLKRFPFPPYSKKIIEIGALFLPTVFAFSMMSSVVYIVRNVVMEKENRLKEYMKVMGMHSWIDWAAHFVGNYAKMLLTVIVSTILMAFVAENTDITIIFVLLAFYAFTATYFALAVSTFANSGTAGILMAVVGWIILFFWSTFFSSIDIQQPHTYQAQLLNCLNPNIALSMGLSMLAQYETQAHGMKWHQINTPPSPDQHFTMLQILMALLVDGFILMIITWYVEAVNPKSEGLTQKPYFFVLPSYWFPSLARKAPKNSEVNGIDNSRANVEAEPSYRPTIRVTGLTKIYNAGCSWFTSKSKQKIAVDKLTLNMYEGHCTALLGHNGAGKSTTFSMLCGLIDSTSGTAYINDYDIRTAMPMIRKQLGFCPQYNILVDQMTVMEHLEFFSKVKNRGWEPEEALRLLRQLKLENKKDDFAGKLSGGQKRKLSLCIALIGGSEIVMLDEPTSGMDPGARHEAWTLIQKEKRNRTILLTTHYMEEADLLGDRIAIMANGQLQCCGSSLFLKKHYGAGYHVVVVMESKKEGEENKVDKLRRFLATLSENIVFQSITGNELTFLLPNEERPRFPKIFGDLEDKQSELGIQSFGVSITTMEEVFLKVNNIAEGSTSTEVIDDTNIAKGLNELRNSQDSIRHSGVHLLLHQSKALLFSKLMYYKAQFKQVVVQIIVPVLYMALFVWTATTFPNAEEQDPLTIDYSSFSIDEPANIIVNSLNTDLPRRINSTLDMWDPELPRVVNYVTNITAGLENLTEIIAGTCHEQGTRRFGLHNPVAIEEKSRTFMETIEVTFMTGLFNNFALHSPPLAVSLVDSVLFQRTVNRSIAFTTVNHPLPPTYEDKLKNSQNTQSSGMVIGYAIIAAMSMAISAYAAFLIRERKKKFKHMQIMMGLPLWLYWVMQFVMDLVLYVIPVLLILVVFKLFEISVYVHDASILAMLFGFMLLFYWTAVPFVYCLSFLFGCAPKGNTLIVIYNIITGMIGAIAVPILKQTDGEDVAYTWEIVFSFLFPTFTINNLFVKVYSNEFNRLSCKQINCELEIFKKTVGFCCGNDDERSFVDEIYWNTSKKGLFYSTLFLLIEGFIYWFVLYLIESGKISDIKEFLSMKKANQDQKGKENEAFDVEVPLTDEQDVMEEKRNIKSMKPKDHPVVVDGLSKTYGNFRAVKEVNFHVTEKDCFGLLGVNGAGKTSTFQMITGENKITSGNAYIQGHSVKTEWREACYNAGYCPQYDAVMKELTGIETLSHLARIRGIKEKDVSIIVKTIITAIGIEKYGNKQIKTYSGGNKRRLSMGIALIGMPSVMLLDEPTTGVDPKARRFIWSILSHLRETGMAIVLTSHSMEECEALCTNLAIMVGGEFVCMGSPQHIKNKYGSGYSLIVTLEDEKYSKEAIKKTEDTFPGAVLKEQHLFQLRFELPKRAEQRWSQLFAELERLSVACHFVDYSLSQTTLEQVFLQFSHLGLQDETTKL